MMITHNVCFDLEKSNFRLIITVLYPSCNINSWRILPVMLSSERICFRRILISFLSLNHFSFSSDKHRLLSLNLSNIRSNKLFKSSKVIKLESRSVSQNINSIISYCMQRGKIMHLDIHFLSWRWLDTVMFISHACLPKKFECNLKLLKIGRIQFKVCMCNMSLVPFIRSWMAPNLMYLW